MAVAPPPSNVSVVAYVLLMGKPTTRLTVNEVGDKAEPEKAADVDVTVKAVDEDDAVMVPDATVNDEPLIDKVWLAGPPLSV